MSEESPHALRAHSKLGASSSERWLNCPGSVALIETCPPAKSSFFAEEGTAAHELAETVLRGDPGPNANFYIGKKKFNGFDVNQDMATHVQSYVDYVRNIKNAIKGELLIEHKFHLKSVHPLFYGTCDAVVFQPFGELHIIDLKYGAGHAVDVEQNTQLQFYALGALDLGDFEKVIIHVAQPRAFHPDGPFRTWETTPDALIEFGKLLKSKAIETQKENAPFAQGDWCRWCAAAPVCPQLRRTAIEVAKSDFMEEPKLPQIEALREEQIQTIIKYKKAVTAWFDAVEEHALERLLRGEKIEGIKIVQGKSKREWVNEDDAAKFLSRTLGENAYSRKLLSVSQAEKELGKDRVVGLFQTLGGGPKVVDTGDKRPALNPNDFAIENIEHTKTHNIEAKIDKKKTPRKSAKIEEINDF